MKQTTSCKPVVSTKCQNIKYQECKEEPKETCEDRDMMIPQQEKEHKKKCLLPDNGITGAGASARGTKADLVTGKAIKIVVFTYERACVHSQNNALENQFNISMP